jgi:hypothetical protein
MRTLRRRPNRKDLREAYSLQTRPERRAFWSEFRSRAAAAPREERVRWWWPVPYHAVARLAAACSIVLMLGVFSYVNVRSASGAGNAVQALDIVGSYESVLIISDTEDQATIVWVDGM